ncbi:MAG TPA: DMT family transporter, partial [Gaiellaceae bacterium]|nr:DMT family transporter [Gaiellaceae bacterium]
PRPLPRPRVDVVLLASLAGAFFGGLAVAVRAGLGRRRDAEAGAFVAASVGCLVCALVAVPLAAADSPSLEGIWLFALVGAFVPGLSQIVFVRAVRDAGASRTAILIGTAPLLSAGLALVLLDEALRPALAGATVAIVLGGALLAWERTRPPDFLVAGALLALLAAFLFAVRDNVVRWASVDTDVDALPAATASLGAAAAVLLLYLAVFRRGETLSGRVRAAAVPFLPAGVCLGLAYASLLLAFSRGPVTVVAPLNATQSLWAVVFAAAFLGRAEAIGARLVFAAVLVVAGSALIGATR